MTITYTRVDVTQTVRVQIDRSKFTEKLMREFRECLYGPESIDDHIEHLAQLHARGLADDDSSIEGYGKASDMGITFEIEPARTWNLGTDEVPNDQADRPAPAGPV